MQLQILVPMIVFIWTSVVVSISLFKLYRPGHVSPNTQGPRRWTDSWSISLESLDRSPYRTLFIVSFLVLFLELILIRWVSSEIRIFAYFKNFVLIACFLGFGLGSSLCRRPISLLPLLAALTTVTILIKFPSRDWHNFLSEIPAFIGTLSEVHIWGIPSVEWSWSSLLTLTSSTAIIAPFFGLLTLIFIPLGQITGRCLEVVPDGVWGYSLNLLASLTGIGFYTLLCFYSQPPPVWFVFGGALSAVLLWNEKRLRWQVPAAFLLCAGFAGLNLVPGSTEYWSPYQKLRIAPRIQNGEIRAYDLATNDSWHQHLINLSPSYVTAHPELFRNIPVEYNPYNLPYRFFPDSPSVLILGSGTGNDVAAALRNQTSQIVAVEIDPLILELGKRFHFEKPYDSPRVKIVLQDARSYLQNSSGQFDLIVFSLLDSHTNSSHYSNVRIDSYVYTLEAMQAAKRLLSPKGLIIVKFQVTTPWIAGRLSNLFATVFGRPPLEFWNEEGNFFFMEGSRTRIEGGLADKRLAAYIQQRGTPPKEAATLTTDDWPYFYQHEPGLPASVIAISVVLLLLCWLALTKTGLPVTSIQWHFFFLGAGFLLLEVQIISKMALLFGTTWLVNSIVISGVLLLLVAANLVAKWQPQLPQRLAYAGLFLSLGVCYLVPMEMFFFHSMWLKATSSGLVYCSPVFFAGIVFIQSFREAGFSGRSLGSNLLGSLLGGLLESLSLWTGLKALLVFVFLLYLASLLTMRQTSARRFGAVSDVVRF
jgi:SAM-dependent methyltransferase